MSIWISRRDEQGRRHYYSIHVPLLLAVPLLGITVAVLLPLAAEAPLSTLLVFSSMTLIGFVLFAIAKVHVISSGTWFSFGSSRMTGRMRILYRLGYALMIPGGILTLIIALLVLRFAR